MPKNFKIGIGVMGIERNTEELQIVGEDREGWTKNPQKTPGHRNDGLQAKVRAFQRLQGPVWLTNVRRMYHTNLASRYINILMNVTSHSRMYHRIQCNHLNFDTSETRHKNNKSIPETYFYLQP
jgi:hypothetical protein